MVDGDSRSMPRVRIVPGKDLPQEKKQWVLRKWYTTFQPHLKVPETSDDTFSDYTFFFCEDVNGKTLALCAIGLLSVEFHEKKHDIMKIGGVVAVEKSKGHGKTVITAMTQYLEKNNHVGVGFIARRNAGFYEKCSPSVLQDRVKKVLYKNPEGIIEKNRDSDDMIFYPGGSQLEKDLGAFPNEVFWLPESFW